MQKEIIELYWCFMKLIRWHVLPFESCRLVKVEDSLQAALLQGYS